MSKGIGRRERDKWMQGPERPIRTVLAVKEKSRGTGRLGAGGGQICLEKQVTPAKNH